MTYYGESSFYPSDLLDEYQNLWVRAGSITGNVSVNKYRCSIYGGGTKDAEQVKDGFVSVHGGQIIREAGGAQRFVDVFTGKGSPNAIVTVLQLVHEYRLPFIKACKGVKGPKGDAAALLERNESNPIKMMQEFCDAYLGLDCNGFVGNYVKRVQNKWIGPNTDIASFLRSGKKRKTVDDAYDLDILIFPNNTHIAIIDTFEDDTHAFIAQSTGGGPQMTRHKLIASGGGAFDLDPPTKVKGPVQIISLGL